MGLRIHTMQDFIALLIYALMICGVFIFAITTYLVFRFMYEAFGSDHLDDYPFLDTDMDMSTGGETGGEMEKLVDYDGYGDGDDYGDDGDDKKEEEGEEEEEESIETGRWLD
ncbi:hypothetical protein K504DRAFT_447813 [Pleomassaria siparia CBS 279.74]|uniref:Uncharacterized protein n=1 Tax=Pleomassaria siparia CBS 279.74 TaxID=1314801 RepID=A0A6G1K3J6_9PLEO|nr:hypothetical protein K504DRAFT_447813 [Pleomassaria siparia CBS 279.74]